MLDIQHDFPFDPRHGYTHEQLRSISAPDTEPADFDQFWQSLYQETLSQPLNIERRASTFSDKYWNVEECYFDTLEHQRVGAWLLTPKEGPIQSLRVFGHGYGGREQPSFSHAELRKHTAHLFPVAPGFHISADPAIPLNNAAKHVVHGIESKDTYVFRVCAASLWSAASVLLNLYPLCADSLHYVAWSYGGGMGALMLPWDQRYVCAELGVPSFGHHPIRLKCPCVGSGEAVRAYHREHPEVESVLAYFDAATAARKIKQPMLFGVCAFDPAVPPPGQYAVANACQSEAIISEIEVGHYAVDYPGKIAQGTRHQRNRLKFFDLNAPLEK